MSARTQKWSPSGSARDGAPPSAAPHLRLLNQVRHLDFAVLRETLQISDATLSKHVKTLAAAGYVAIDKAASADRTDARRVTWLSLTPTGRSAFGAHMRALHEIAGSPT